MRDFDFIVSPAKLLTPEIVQMVGSIHEHKGKQELFLESQEGTFPDACIVTCLTTALKGDKM